MATGLNVYMHTQKSQKVTEKLTRMRPI